MTAPQRTQLATTRTALAAAALAAVLVRIGVAGTDVLAIAGGAVGALLAIAVVAGGSWSRVWRVRLTAASTTVVAVVVLVHVVRRA